MSDDYRIVDDLPPRHRNVLKEPIENWVAIAEQARLNSPSWVVVPNVYRVHAMQINDGAKEAFQVHEGRFQAKSRRNPDTDEPRKTTIYVRYLPF